jgi:hypothetical protein
MANILVFFLLLVQEMLKIAREKKRKKQTAKGIYGIFSSESS